jgi:hypothetical protein
MSETLGARMLLLVTAPGAAELVASFYDEDGPFAGSLFDNLGSNPSGQVVIDDLLAVSLLDVGFKPRAVKALLQQGAPDGEIGVLLSAVPASRPLWEATDEDLAGATAIWSKIRDQSRKGVMSGVGSTKRSKLLARKRPHLAPIVDSVIRAALHPHLNETSWRPMREALSDPALRGEIEALRPAKGASDVSLLRLLDTAAWMWCSNSQAARRARSGMGHPLGDWPAK